MKTLFITIKLIILTLFLSYNFTYAWEPYDRIIATVNLKPIVESEVINKLNQINKIRKIKKNKIIFQKSRIIDKFIENALVDEVAEKESILVSDKKVFLHIQKLMINYFSSKYKSEKKLNEFTEKLLERLKIKINNKNSSKYSDLDSQLSKFTNFIENQHKIDFDSFIVEVRNQMKKESVVTISLGVSPPSREEALKWYDKNKRKLGFEVRVKHILVRPKNRSRAEERKTNKYISSLRNRALKGESFEKLAVKYSHDRVSARKGGDIGWTMLATLDPMFAGYVYRMKRRGQISRVFKSSLGYHIVKYIGRRAVKFDNVQRMIIYKLYTEKLNKQFKKWVSRKKRKSDIEIFMKGYIKG